MNTEQQAQLLEEIATVMRERPEDWWREFEWTPSGESGPWEVCENKHQPVNAALDNRLRRRPRTITINGEVSVETAKAVREMHATMVKDSHPERLFRELAALIETSGGEVE